MKSAGSLFSIVCILALAGATFFFFSKNREVEAELARLRQEANEASQLREENAVLQSRAAQVEEVEKLRKENAEIYKLRNEVRQLQKEKQSLAQKMQQAQFAQASQQQQPEFQTAEQLRAENERLHHENEEFQRQRVVAQNNACVNNLKQLDGAKEQWALENRKAVNDLPTFEDLVGPTRYIRNMPACPAGGQYMLNVIGQNPVCNVPGHQLPQ